MASNAEPATTTIAITLGLNLRCAKCGSDLEVTCDESKYLVKVQPCQTCLMTSEESGFDRAAKAALDQIRKNDETRGNFAASFDVEEDA